MFIREAIEREMSRGGQVFFLYNRVASIEKIAREIGELVGDARIAVAHGQMNETELENVMFGCMEGEYDVLVSTTIIETGRSEEHTSELQSRRQVVCRPLLGTIRAPKHLAR